MGFSCLISFSNFLNAVVKVLTASSRFTFNDYNEEGPQTSIFPGHSQEVQRKVLVEYIWNGKI